MCFRDPVTTLLIALRPAIGGRHRGRNPTHMPPPANEASRLDSRCVGRSLSVGPGRECVCARAHTRLGVYGREGVRVFGQAQWIAIPGSTSELPRIPVIALQNKFLKSACDSSRPTTAGFRGRGAAREDVLGRLRRGRGGCGRMLVCVSGIATRSPSPLSPLSSHYLPFPLAVHVGTSSAVLRKRARGSSLCTPLSGLSM